MGRPKAKAKSEDTPPEQKALESQPPDPPASTVSKAEAVRQALAEGKDSLDDIGEFVKVKFGIDIPKTMLSSYKSQQKTRDAKSAGTSPKGKPGRKPKAAVEGFLAPPPKKSTGAGETDLLAAMEAMKPLVAALGAEKVKRIADLLG